MSIETAVFAVQRGGQQFSCKGSDLKDKLTDGDILLVNRGGVDYQYILEGQGALKLIKDVDFEFNDQGAIVITQNAEAEGGELPYEMKTEYDIKLSSDILEEPLRSRVPIKAEVVNGKPYISFGVTGTDEHLNLQDIYSLSIEEASFNSEFINTTNNIPTKINNRYGLKRSTFQGKDIIIDVYNRYGNSSRGDNKHRFTYFGLDEKNITSFKDSSDYYHLHSNSESACTGIISDKDGNYYSCWFGEGLYKHTNIPADSFGYPDFADTSITTTRLLPNSYYYKGLSYHEQSNSILWSDSSQLFQYNISEDSLRSLKSSLESDSSYTAILSFTSNYVIRTIAKGGIDFFGQSCKLNESNIIVRTGPTNTVYINDPDNKYLFKLKGGETVKMLDYNYTGDPLDPGAPWEEFRPEPLPPGNIGEAGTIILEPFNLMWYQGDALKSWGVIPDQTAEATVNQTITDANGDSVSSSTTKAPTS